MAVTWLVPKKGLQEQFLTDVDMVLGKSPFHWYVTAGFRSLPEQDVLWKKYLEGGPLAAPPGKSAHNFGLAIDVVPDKDPTKPGLQPGWSLLKKAKEYAAWIWLKVTIAKHPRLTHGSKFGDWPHIQRYNWPLHRYPVQ
jgi:hypothetical protein